MDNVAAMSIETEDELEGLRRAGRVVAVVLRELRRRVQPGATTADLDALAGRVFARHGARSVPKLVYDAPCEVFISVNDEALKAGLGAATHGAPVRAISQAVADEARRHCVSPLEQLGGPEIVARDDGWTISTADGAPAAHVEHTIVVTDGVPLVLTR